ncbi:hypothetical protein ACOSQ3_009980 [Xanthoceras sorbifolium]
MKSTNLGVEEFTTELVIDPQIKSLHLAWNGNLSDEFMKKKTIGDALRGLPNLVTVGLGGIRIASIDSFFQRSFVCVKGLCVIKFSKSPISDELLHWLANLCLPLKKVLFSECYNFSFVGLCFLLSKNCFPEYLNLEGANFLSDGSMIELSQYLSRLILKSINLDLCSKLTISTFFTLIRKCHVLSKTRMESTNLGVEESTTELVIDPRNKSLHLAWNGNLGDELMKKVAFICPNLQLLDVSDYRIITKEGIGEIFKSCGEIQCLRIESCRHINSLGIKHFDVKKLEVLQVGASRINGWPSDGDINFPVYGIFDSIGVTNSSVVPLSRKLTNLTKIDLSGNKPITDKSIASIWTNCVLLRDFSILDCPIIIQKTIGEAMRHLQNLVSVGLGGIRIASIDSFF